eukprot:1188704-Prorocentrum_minimum.AAC.2
MSSIRLRNLGHLEAGEGPVAELLLQRLRVLAKRLVRERRLSDVHVPRVRPRRRRHVAGLHHVVHLRGGQEG